MRKTAVVLTAVIGSALIAGCQADFPSQDTDGYVKEIVNDVKEQAVQELKKAFASEVSDFFASDDLSVTLGMTGEEKEQLEAALHKATVSCYSIEGAYPPSLEYLIENYGIQINTKRFTVKYEYCASNMMPDITVLEYPYENSH